MRDHQKHIERTFGEPLNRPQLYEGYMLHFSFFE
jgi:hypothetical protein